MKLLYSSENKIFVDNIKNVLTMNGIECEMKNEYLGSAAGDLAPFDTWPELWVVYPEHYKKAQNLIDDMEKNVGRADWFCHKCKESNAASFEICWHCGFDSE